MEYKLIKGKQSNYEIQINLTDEDIKKFEEKILKDFQKNLEVPWFRKWYVPLEVVKQFVKPEYIKSGIYEYAINEAFKKILEENKDINFIWQIYDLNISEDGKKISFKMDVYPEVEILNENWKSIKLDKIDDKVTEEEINQVIENLKNQYAEYKDVDVVNENNIVKAKLYYKNKKWEVVETGTVYLWEEDFKEFEIIKNNFVGRKKWEKIELNYSKKDFPPHLQHKDSKKRPSILEIEIVDIKEKVLPQIDDKFIKEKFGEEIKDVNQLKEKIKEEIKRVKYQEWLVNAIESFLKKAEASFDIKLPKTIIDEEIKARLKSLTQRFGWEEGLKKYFETIWKEKTEKLLEDIKKASEESLRKFFIMRKILKELGLEEKVDWNKPLDVEEKLYQALSK